MHKYFPADLAFSDAFVFHAGAQIMKYGHGICRFRQIVLAFCLAHFPSPALVFQRSRASAGVRPMLRAITPDLLHST
jgi:hypothetical protein